ncbi:hypothetical protein SD70_08780 [Gordoniibacillus kamchatkensis]|uniref:Beta-lactamase-related domain-containing protein n=1 Tax=Gordoniibacillus kamchatkensis TaxID=1590651 RepID=A0ABR5AJA4_9BACL|nr:hypothetical protein [Paenibacillus sp. VKM B-2647]KIL41126.1 hypothetical protein SD70_08780 [Paenibacillus sp. VKM B-2647]
MEACSTWTYRNVTQGVFQTLQAVGRRQGFAIPGAPSGSFAIRVAGMQVGFRYGWDARSGTLMLTCVSKPMLLGCATIKSFADRIVGEAGGKVAG